MIFFTCIHSLYCFDTHDRILLSVVPNHHVNRRPGSQSRSSEFKYRNRRICFDDAINEWLPEF